MTGFLFQKELMLIKQMHQKIVRYEPYLCNGCHDLIQKVMDFDDAAVVSVKGSDCRIHFLHMSKNDAVNIMTLSDLKKVDNYNIFKL